jgi:DNA-binding XRE family transcriptional regulator
MNKKQLKSADPYVRKWLKDPEVRMYYQQEKAKSDIAMAIFYARKKANLTQTALAKKAGTSQSVIARLEGGKDSRMPSMPLLASVAKACGGFFEFGFTFKRPPRHKAA